MVVPCKCIFAELAADDPLLALSSPAIARRVVDRVSEWPAGDETLRYPLGPLVWCVRFCLALSALVEPRDGNTVGIQDCKTEPVVGNLPVVLVAVCRDLEAVRNTEATEFDDTGFGFPEDERWRDALAIATGGLFECVSNPLIGLY